MKQKTQSVKPCIALITDLYLSERSRYVRMQRGSHPFVPKRNGESMSLSDNVLTSHLAGKYAIAVYASQEGSKFICFDVDDGQWVSVQAILDCLEMLGVDRNYLHVSTSGGKGYHVEMFFDDLVPIDLLYSLYDMVIQRTLLNRKKVEYRPSSHQAVKLPLSVHHKTGRICWFIDKKDGHPFEDWTYLKTIQKLPAAEVIAWIEHLKPMRLVTPSALDHFILKTNTYSSSIPTIHLAPLRMKGMRHTATVKHAVRMRRSGISQEECLERILIWQSEQDKALYASSTKAIRRDIEEIVEWAYAVKDVRRSQETHIIITRHDMLRIFMIPKKVKRKLLFLLTVWEKAGYPSFSHEQLAKKLDCCSKTVKAMIDELVVEGFLEQTEGKSRFVSGIGFCRSRNTYHCLQQQGAPDSIAHSVSIPRKNVLKLLSYWMYTCANHLLRMDEVMSVLSTKELSEIKCWLKKHASDIQPLEAASQAAS